MHDQIGVNYNSTKRLDYLDGSRAIFCLIVFTSHFVSAFYPNMVRIFFNDGNLAVMYFFILSGYVTAFSLNRKIPDAEEKLDYLAPVKFCIKRYARLLPTVSVSILMSYCIVKCNGYFSEQAGVVFGLDWMSGFFGFDNVTFKEAVTTAFFGAFVEKSRLNNPLWTIKYEWVVLSILYAYFYLTCRKKYRWVITACFLVVLNVFTSICGYESVYILCILVGLLIGEIQIRTPDLFDKGMSSCVCRGGVPVLICAIYALTFFGKKVYFLRMAVAVLILIQILSSKCLQRALGGKWIVWLGRLSYEMYAFHWLVICSVACGGMLLFFENWYVIGTIIMYVISLAITLFTAVILKRLELLLPGS